jgi:hypothetical protein
MEPKHSLIDLAAANYGVLSQILCQHHQHLAAANPAALNEADHHPHMLEHLRVWPDGADFGRGCPGPTSWGRRRCSRRAFATSALIDILLPFFSLLVAVIGAAASNGLLPAMRLPAAEGTPHFVALLHIAGMSQKENAAVPASSPAQAQVRLGPQNRSQHNIIFQHQVGYRALAIPIRPKLKMLRNRYCKKPKL